MTYVNVRTAADVVLSLCVQFDRSLTRAAVMVRGPQAPLIAVTSMVHQQSWLHVFGGNSSDVGPDFAAAIRSDSQAIELACKPLALVCTDVTPRGTHMLAVSGDDGSMRCFGWSGDSRQVPRSPLAAARCDGACRCAHPQLRAPLLRVLHCGASQYVPVAAARAFPELALLLASERIILSMDVWCVCLCRLVGPPRAVACLTPPG